MAGAKYTSTFHQNKSYSTTGEWKLDIYSAAGGSTTEFVTVRNSIKLERGGDWDDELRSTTLSFSIKNITEGQYIEFSTADWGDYYCELIYDPSGSNTKKFTGYLQTEIYREDLEQVPYDMELQFTDGLAHLDYERFDSSDRNLSETGVDANALTTSASVTKSSPVNAIYFEVIESSGSNDDHIVTLQTSTDNIIWIDTDYTIKGLGTLLAENITPSYVRLKVTTVEGAASVIDWNIKPRFSGQKSIIEVLRLCLNKLANPLPIREYVNIYEDSISSGTGDSMLNQIWVDASLYKEEEKEGSQNEESPMMCSQVIREILKTLGCHIYIWDNTWFIFRKQEYKDATLYWRSFTANAGTENSIIVDQINVSTTNERDITNANTATTDIILPVAGADKEIRVPLNRAKIIYNNQNLDFESNNLLKNGDFSKITHNWAYSTDNGRPTFWTPSAAFAVHTYYAMHPTNFSSSPSAGESNYFEFNPTLYRTATNFNSLQYLQYTKAGVPTATTDILQLSFDLAIGLTFTVSAGQQSSIPSVNQWLSNDLEVKFFMQIKFGTYYLGGSDVGGFNWTTSSTVCSFQVNGFGTQLSAGYSSAGHTIKGNAVATILQDLPLLPQTGLYDMQIRIYQPYTDISSYSTAWTGGTITFDYLYQGNYNLLYLPAQVQPIEEQILYLTINEDEDYEEIETIHGDGPNTISQGSFRLSTGVITDVWNRRGKTDNWGILRTLVESIAEDRGDWTDIVNGNLIGEFEAYNSFSMTIGSVTKSYALDTYSYMVETNEWAVRLLELESFTKFTVWLDSSRQTGQQRIGNTGKGTSGFPNQINAPSQTLKSVMLNTVNVITVNQQNMNDFN